MDYFQQRFNEDLDSQQYANYMGEYSWSGSILGMYGCSEGLGSLMVLGPQGCFGLSRQLYNADNPQQPSATRPRRLERLYVHLPARKYFAPIQNRK
jgi:hypothetical protein